MSALIDHKIEGGPDFATLTVNLKTGEKMYAEPAAMMSMDPSVSFRSGLKGGLLKSVARKLGGESFVVNTYTADQAGEVVFAPGPLGDINHYVLDGSGSLMLQRGAYVASGTGVDVSGKWQGMKGFFSGEGLVLLKATGQGDLWFNTYGAIVEVQVDGSHVVDTGYVVAFEDTLQYRVSMLQGLSIGRKLKTFFLGGEGLVCHFSGQGRLWVQTRAAASFLNWVHWFRPVKSRD